MDLLDRYLQAVRFFFPRRQQDDIVRELSENLRSQIEDRQDSLDRPLNEEEVAEILRRHGHPMLVAGRYRSHQQLIGPVFFPIYLVALQLGLAACFAVTVVLAVVSSALTGDPIRHAVDAMLAFPGRALMVFAWTTLPFAALDFAQARLKLPRTWDPRTLPKVVRHEDRVSRVAAVSELLFVAAAVIWLLLVPNAPFLMLGPAAEFLELAPIWSAAYLPILVLTVATMVVAGVTVARPYWTPARSWARLAIHAGTLVLVGWVLRSGVWVLARDGGVAADGAALVRLVDVVNASVQIGLFFTGLVSLWEVGRHIHRLRRVQSSGFKVQGSGA